MTTTSFADRVIQTMRNRIATSYQIACLDAWLRHQGWIPALNHGELVRYVPGKPYPEVVKLVDAIEAYNNRFLGVRIVDGITWGRPLGDSKDA